MGCDVGQFVLWDSARGRKAQSGFQTVEAARRYARKRGKHYTVRCFTSAGLTDVRGNKPKPKPPPPPTPKVRSVPRYCYRGGARRARWGSPRQVWPKTKERILELAEQHDVPEIARRLGKSQATVERVLAAVSDGDAL